MISNQGKLAQMQCHWLLKRVSLGTNLNEGADSPMQTEGCRWKEDKPSPEDTQVFLSDKLRKSIIAVKIPDDADKIRQENPDKLPALLNYAAYLNNNIAINAFLDLCESNEFDWFGHSVMLQEEVIGGEKSNGGEAFTRVILKYTVPFEGKTENGAFPFETATPAIVWMLRHNNVEAMRKLIRAGCNRNVIARDGRYEVTPLSFAAKNGLEEAFKVLIQEGGDQKKERDISLDCDNTSFFSPAHWAARQGHVNILKALKAAGANLDGTSPDGRTPLHLACKYLSVEAVEVLLKLAGDKVKDWVDSVDENGNTPLMLTVKRSLSELFREYRKEEDKIIKILDLLTVSKANWNLKNIKGDTVLHIFAENLHDRSWNLVINDAGEIVKEFKSASINLHIRNSAEQSAVDIHKRKSHPDSVDEGWVKYQEMARRSSTSLKTQKDYDEYCFEASLGFEASLDLPIYYPKNHKLPGTTFISPRVEAHEINLVKFMVKHGLHKLDPQKIEWITQNLEVAQKKYKMPGKSAKEIIEALEKMKKEALSDQKNAWLIGFILNSPTFNEADGKMHLKASDGGTQNINTKAALVCLFLLAFFMLDDKLEKMQPGEIDKVIEMLMKLLKKAGLPEDVDPEKIEGPIFKALHAIVSELRKKGFNVAPLIESLKGQMKAVRWEVKHKTNEWPDFSTFFDNRLITAGLKEMIVLIASLLGVSATILEDRVFRPFYDKAAAATVAQNEVESLAKECKASMGDKLWNEFIENEGELLKVKFSEIPAHIQAKLPLNGCVVWAKENNCSIYLGMQYNAYLHEKYTKEAKRCFDSLDDDTLRSIATEEIKEEIEKEKTDSSMNSDIEDAKKDRRISEKVEEYKELRQAVMNFIDVGTHRWGTKCSARYSGELSPEIEYWLFCIADRAANNVNDMLERKEKPLDSGARKTRSQSREQQKVKEAALSASNGRVTRSATKRKAEEAFKAPIAVT